MLFVFDLDFTLWDAGGTWCDHTMPPYRKLNGHVEDGDGRMIALYPEVRSILDRLDRKGIQMAVASRSHSPVIARRLIDLFGIGDYFKYIQIYPGNKVRHFRILHKESGIPYDQMYFFDDEYRNIEAVEHLGVRTRHITGGLNWEEMHEFGDLSLVM